MSHTAAGEGPAFSLIAERSERATLRVGWRGQPSVTVKVSVVADGFANEVASRTLLYGAGLEIALPLSYVPGPPAVLTLPWLEGASVDGTSQESVLEEVGTLMARIHGLNGGPPFAGNSTWSSWMRGWLSHAIEWWDREVSTDIGRMSYLPHVLDGLADEMDAAATSMILFDCRPEHFIVTPTGGVGMIDTEELRAGDPAMDLAVIELWEPGILPAVIRGYTRLGRELDRTFADRRRFYVIIRSLAAAEWHSAVVPDPDIRDRCVRLARQLSATVT